MFYKCFCWFLGCSADTVFGDISVFQAFGFLSMNSGCDSGYFFVGCPVPDSEGVIPGPLGKRKLSYVKRFKLTGDFVPLSANP